MTNQSQSAPLLDFLLTRRSVRHFTRQPIPREVVERMIATATWAPSAHNRQPWRFVVLITPEIRRRLADKMGEDFRRDLEADGFPEEEISSRLERSRVRLLRAPVGVVLCLDISAGDEYPDERRQWTEYLMGVQSVAQAGLQLLLAAHAVGLGGVWTCSPLFAPRTVRVVLDLPEYWDPQALIFLGEPERIPDPRPRLPLESLVRFV